MEENIESRSSSQSETEEKSFRKDINTFVSGVRAIHHAYDIAYKSIEEHTLSKIKKLKDFVDKNISNKSDIHGGERELSQDFNLYDFKGAAQGVILSAHAFTTVQQSLLVSLVSKWDAFFASILNNIFQYAPGIIDNSVRTLKFSDLKSFVSIEEARSSIVGAEIDDIMRKSHAEHFKYLEDKISLSGYREDPTWKKFIEITERRNLFVHTEGRVSSQYIRVCKEHKIGLKEDIKIGDQLPSDPDYFKNSCSDMIEFGVKLGQGLWRKYDKKSHQSQDESLSTVTFDLITDKWYQTAINLLEHSLKAPMSYHSTEARARCIINLAQAYKWSGDENRCASTLRKQDWSMATERFKLALSVLKGDFVKAGELMLSLGSSGGIDKHDYKSWPLFQEFRKDKLYRENYEKIFGISPEQDELSDSLVMDPEARDALETISKQDGKSGSN